MATNDKTKKVLKITLPIVAALVVAILAIAFFWGTLIPSYRPLHEAKAGDVRVACVGDSITYGTLVFGWPFKTYPETLGKKLGDGYTVNNYGYPGACAQEDSDKPYKSLAVYKKSKEFLPNIVIMMLGTNDTREVNRKGIEFYKRDYSLLIDEYLNLSSLPTVILMAPPPAWPFLGKVGYHIGASMLENEIHETVLAIGEEKGLIVIDLWATFNGKKDLFTDGVHPTASGAEVLAETVFNKLQSTVLKAA